MSTVTPFPGVTMECFYFHWRLGRLKHFQLASRLFIKEKKWFESFMAAPNWNNSLKRKQSSTLNKAAQQDSVQCSTEQGQWHSFPGGRWLLQAPKATPQSQKCPQALALISSTLSLSGTLAAPRAGVQTPGFSQQPWDLIFLAWITIQLERFCCWLFKGRYWPKLQPGWKVTLIKPTLYKQGTQGEFFPGIHLNLLLGAVPEPKHWECCPPGLWSTLDWWVQPLRELLLCL